ncbi:hypothetical protein GWI33_007494 [Rhynchophorus ferrugineus]|uniref:Uncharacterized protein n=1 Tax=Rhynchophorus ferrugineus TaxID=354439 RepID=A0A834IDF8_RHYFE|nr:hypothetical protein GWI33_007494 [Rhynchophorus ferrugineus]
MNPSLENKLVEIEKCLFGHDNLYRDVAAASAEVQYGQRRQRSASRTSRRPGVWRASLGRRLVGVDELDRGETTTPGKRCRSCRSIDKLLTHQILTRMPPPPPSNPGPATPISTRFIFIKGAATGTAPKPPPPAKPYAAVDDENKISSAKIVGDIGSTPSSK